MSTANENRLCKLEATVSSILDRNKKVEREKAWEQSRTRVASIVVLTYALMCLVFYFIGNSNFMINAIVPTLGYFLSTLSLSLIKRWWMGRKPK